jgi:hypothetical protein
LVKKIIDAFDKAETEEKRKEEIAEKQSNKLNKSSK